MRGGSTAPFHFLENNMLWSAFMFLCGLLSAHLVASAFIHV